MYKNDWWILEALAITLSYKDEPDNVGISGQFFREIKKTVLKCWFLNAIFGENCMNIMISWFCLIHLGASLAQLV